MFKSTLSAGLLSLALINSASAIVIVDNMNTPPATNEGYSNNYPWTGVIFGGTGMSANNGVTWLDTQAYRGVWYGNGTYLGQNPGWSLGSAQSGNYLSLTMRLSADAEDWSAYFHDASGYAAYLSFNPAGSYDKDRKLGFEFSYLNELQQHKSTFVEFDLSSEFHTFEVLLKNGMVEYAIDGHLLFSGQAISGISNLLVIGDGSGSSPSGLGHMFIDRTVFDTAPTINHLNTVPLPASAWLMASGLLGLGMARRRK